jgi:hypothetical protein
VVSVDGREANQSAYLIAYSSNGGSGRQKVYLALDQLIRRELLAQAAEQRGIRATGEMADEEIKRGSFFLGGERIDFSRQFFDEVDGEKFFSYKRFKAWVGSLNVSAGSYRDEQARGLQAAIMNQLISGSVRVSHEEALANYLYEKNTVTYDAVAFDPANYRRAMRLTEADTSRFLEGHKAEVEARFKADERTYKGVKPQLELREIFIPKALPEAAKPADDKPVEPASGKPDDKAAKPADPKAAAAADKKPADPKSADKAAAPADKKLAAPKAADKVATPADKTPADRKAGDANAKPADGKAAGAAAKPADANAKKADDKAARPAKPFGLPTDAAKAKLESVRTAVAAGKLTFPDAEKQMAADASGDAPAENGYRGWRSVDNAELGDTAVNDAVKALKPGEMTPVIVTNRGTYLVMAIAKREGDLSFDQVKTEIASSLAKDVWSKEAAKRDAIDALAKARSGTGKNLDQMFERELVPPGGNELQRILQDPNISPEEKQQLLQLMQQRRGSLEVQEKDVPVAWYADADGSATPAAGSAAGSAAGGSAAPAAGTGSAAAPPIPPAPPAPVTIEPSKDVLPQIGEVPKAKINRLGPVPRQAKMQGIGGSKEAAKEAVDALFDDLAPGSLAKKVYEGDGGGYVILQLVNRQQPSVEEFDKIADDEITRMQAARGKAALRNWLKNRCDVLTKAGKIRPAADRIQETDDKGNRAPTVYHPCMYFDYLDR